VRLDHIGIAVASLPDAIARWQSLLGPPATAPEEVPGNQVRVAFFASGGTHLEFLEPSGPTSPISKFLASRGEGIHHIAFAVPSVDAALAEVAKRGGRLVDTVGRPGARGRRVGFAHPSAFGGVLVEFVEAP